MGEHLGSAFRNIIRKRTRTGLTILGIAIGVMSVLLISVISDVGKQAVNQELQDMGANGILISANAKKKNIQLNLKGLEQLRNTEIDADVSPLVIHYSSAKMKKQTSDCVIWGIDKNLPQIVSLKLTHGRMIDQGDIDNMSQVCLVDENYALNTYQRTNIVGKEIDLLIGGSYQSFEIIGVIQSGGNILQTLMGDIVPCFTYIPYTSMQVLSNQATFTQFVAKANEDADNTSVSELLVETLNDVYGASNAVKAEDLNSQMDMLNSMLNIVTMVLTVIAGISLLVSGLSIMTIMLVSVSERTREIGIKKSIGASRRVILWEFLSESFLVSVIGAVAGSLFAGVLIWIGSMLIGIAVTINLLVILGCLGFSLIIGVLFGVYPALKAASLKPVDALRYE